MASNTIALDRDQYEALLNWARLGASENDELPQFNALRKHVDLDHNITRYTLVIRWQRLTAWGVSPARQALDALPTPRGETRVLELLRPPTRADVLAALEGELFHERLIWVTRDPRGEVGWYDLENFPWQG